MIIDKLFPFVKKYFFCHQLAILGEKVPLDIIENFSVIVLKQKKKKKKFNMSFLGDS